MGAYDPLRRHPDVPGVDWFAYVDQDQGPEAGWTVVNMGPAREHPRARAKFYKIRTVEILPEHDYTIWMDGSFEVTDGGFIDECLTAVGPSGMAVYRHPERDCVYDEALVSTSMLKYSGLPILRQMAVYRSEDHPEHWGLCYCGIIVRRNTPAVNAVMGAWWSEEARLGLLHNDQLSFPVVCRRLNFRPDIIPGDQLSDRWHRWHRHRTSL